MPFWCTWCECIVGPMCIDGSSSMFRPANAVAQNRISSAVELSWPFLFMFFYNHLFQVHSSILGTSSDHREESGISSLWHKVNSKDDTQVPCFSSPSTSSLSSMFSWPVETEENTSNINHQFLSLEINIIDIAKKVCINLLIICLILSHIRKRHKRENKWDLKKKKSISSRPIWV